MKGTQSSGPILCAVDQSAPSDTALAVAVSLVEKLRRPLHLVHVLTPSLAGLGKSEAQDFLEESVNMGSADRSHIEFGLASDGIYKVAERIDASLVVMGTHSRGRFGRLFFGSTASEVLGSARWPLLVVRENTVWPPVRVFVGENFSESAKYSKTLAAKISSAYSAELTLIEALPELVKITHHADPRGRRAAAMWERATTHMDEEVVALAAETGETPGSTIRLVSPQQALAYTTKLTDSPLIVVGHRSALERRESGETSVAEFLVHSVNAPILIYPEDAIDRVAVHSTGTLVQEVEPVNADAEQILNRHSG